MCNAKAKFIASVSPFLAAAVCYAANLSQPFDGNDFGAWSSEDAAVGKWIGDGAVTNIAPKSASPTVGSPIGGAADLTSLAVNGLVVCSNSTHSAARYSQTEMLVRVDAPVDALPVNGLDDLQIALCVGTNYVEEVKVPLYVYCIPKNGQETAAWKDISTIATGSWARVTMISDYENGLCKVCVDGLPAVSQHGYLLTDTTSQTDVDGAWYRMPAQPDAADVVESITLRGEGCFDDVVVSQNDEPDFGAETTNVVVYSGDGGRGVTNTLYTSLAKWGVVERTASLARLDDSGLSVSQKLEAGLDPLSGDVLESKFVERTMDDSRITVGYVGVSPDTWHAFRIFDGNNPSVRYIVKYDAEGKRWTGGVVGGVESPTEIEEPCFSGGEGVRYASFHVPEELRASRSLVIQVIAMANDSAM